jgi:hypothetical protein
LEFKNNRATQWYDGPNFSMSDMAILQQFGAIFPTMLIPERKNKVWLAIQWGALVLAAIALWAFAK